MTRTSRSLLVVFLFGIVLVLLIGGTAAGSDDQIVSAQVVSIAPRWFDPAEAEPIITPYIFYYALHDAVVKPMPGAPLAPSLAESWTMSPDGLTYDFALRRGVRFHNGDTVSAEDVKFSFERYRGAAASLLKAKIAAVEVVDPLRVRFRLKQPWPDFMTFYGTPATGAGWIVPKRIREQATELDGKRREALLHRIQQLMYDKVMYAPIMEPAILYGVGPRVAESALGLITNMAGCAPYEELRLKSR